jgi:quinone-modifying oxidoreductase, subunit QmoC
MHQAEINTFYENAVLEEKTDKTALDIKAMVEALINVVPNILKHQKFNEIELDLIV